MLLADLNITFRDTRDLEGAVGDVARRAHSLGRQLDSAYRRVEGLHLRRDLYQALIFDLSRARLLVSKLIHLATGHGQSGFPDRVSVSDALEELVATVERAHRRIADLRAAVPEGTRRPSERTGVRVTRTAVQMVAWAARVQPAADRLRYSEEFLVELWDLAAAGARRPGQLRYAAWQLVRALWLRSELKKSRASKRAVL